MNHHYPIHNSFHHPYIVAPQGRMQSYKDEKLKFRRLGIIIPTPKSAHPYLKSANPLFKTETSNSKSGLP